MAKAKTAHAYELEIKKMIEKRNGEFDMWLIPQLRTTALNCVMLDKIHDELCSERSLLITSSGSMDQVKYEAHPLLAHYDKLQRTLLQQFEALGLNYRATPSKINETTRKGVEESDPMAGFYTDAKK